MADAKSRIKWLTKQKESDTIEFKEFEKLENINDRGRRDLAVLFAAFANNKGGTVLFGVTDDRELQGYNLSEDKFKKFEQLLIQIADKKCSPSIHLENISLLDDGHNYLLQVQVPPKKGYPHSVDARFYKRVGSHNLPITDPTKVKELFEERMEKPQEKISDYDEIELEEVSNRAPNILIGDKEVPYLRIKSKESLSCFLFGGVYGFSGGVHYNYITVHGMSLEKLERILKAYYSIFGMDGTSFIINQKCNKNEVNYSWFGYGPKNFILALREQPKRYSKADIVSPHHREVAGFVDDRQDFIFYIGLQPNVAKENKDISLDYVNIGFVFDSMPFDNRKFINFYEKVGLKAPNYINYDGEDLDFEYINLRKAETKLEKEGSVIYKSRFDDEPWVSSIICKNPFYGNKNLPRCLSNHEKIIINLGDHHHVKDNERYLLEGVRIVPLPHPNFEFNVLNVLGNW